MILYHGTNVDFDIIDISKSNPYKDFGQGFYLTDIQEQAKNLAEKKTRIFGGEPIVMQFLFDANLLTGNEMKVLKFDSPNKEWAEFIYKNRNREMEFHHDYDIVIGPIANDGVAYLLGRYEEGTITLDELARDLEYKHLNSQYFFGTDKAIKYLKRI
mgnify:CR=1 FL=1